MQQEGYKNTDAQKGLTICPVAGTLIFLLSTSSPSPPPPPWGWNSTCSQRQSDGVVTVTTSPFRENTLNKDKKTVVKNTCIKTHQEIRLQRILPAVKRLRLQHQQGVSVFEWQLLQGPLHVVGWEHPPPARPSSLSCSLLPFLSSLMLLAQQTLLRLPQRLLHLPECHATRKPSRLPLESWSPVFKTTSPLLIFHPVPRLLLHVFIQKGTDHSQQHGLPLGSS